VVNLLEKPEVIILDRLGNPTRSRCRPCGPVASVSGRPGRLPAQVYQTRNWGCLGNQPLSMQFTIPGFASIPHA